MSLTPQKVCNLDCIYCQLGKTTSRVHVRSEYADIDEILKELNSWVADNPKEAAALDYITLSGAGEPTLNSRLGELIGGLKKVSAAKIAVITNSSLMTDADVRAELKDADLIIPSLDAADPETFARIDRPDPNISLKEVIDGLASLKKEFSGRVWLEIMLIRGVNDSPEHISELKEAVSRIKPDKIQLNSPVRTTAEPGIMPVDRIRLEEIRKALGAKCEII